jgi:hypothetical protein
MQKTVPANEPDISEIPRQLLLRDPPRLNRKGRRRHQGIQYDGELPMVQMKPGGNDVILHSLADEARRKRQKNQVIVVVRPQFRTVTLHLQKPLLHSGQATRAIRARLSLLAASALPPEGVAANSA